MLGYNASTGKVNFDPPYTFSYNEDGLMDKIYSHNKLVYTCEYDDYGNLVKRSENGLPTLSFSFLYTYNSCFSTLALAGRPLFLVVGLAFET